MRHATDSNDLRALLARALSDEVCRLLELAVRVAAEHDAPIYLVGGPVRDLLLGNPITDLDLVVEGDAWPIAAAFEALTGGRLTRHAQFRTAAIEVEADGRPFVIDFVTARRERYPAPAALPVVTPSNIRDDLFRRDFTINTLALRLDSSGAIDLLDLFGGLADLQGGILRALHAASFIDDPTRMLRGARFAGRLAFEPEAWTRSLIDGAIKQGLIERTTPQRILREIELTLQEPEPERALAILRAWDALPQLRLAWHDELPARFAAARAANWTDVPLPAVYLGLLIAAMSHMQRVAFAARYNLPGWARALLVELPRALDIPSDAVADDAVLESRLKRLSLPTLRTLQIVAPPPLRGRITRYVDQLRELPPLLSGDDLRAYGMAPGPAFRTILDEARQAQLRGALTTREAALQWLRRRLDDEGHRTC